MIAAALGSAQVQPGPAYGQADSVSAPGDSGRDDAIQAATAAIERLERAETEQERRALFAEINRLLTQIEQDQPDNPWLSFLLARTYIAAGRSGEAIDQLQKFVATREGRTDWRAYRMLGDLFVDEFPRLAKGNYEKARALKADEPSVLHGLSVVAGKLGDRESAVRLARRAVEADGRRTVRYLTHLARLLVNDGQLEAAEGTAAAALEVARKSLEDHPGRRSVIQIVDAQTGLMIDVLQRRIARAVEQASETNGPSPAALGDLHVRLANHLRERAELTRRLADHDALQVLERGVQRTEPNPPAGLLEPYAVALAEAGRTEEAVAAFERLLAVDPGNGSASGWITRLTSRSEAEQDASSSEAPRP